jgi:hypothetical protein
VQQGLGPDHSAAAVEVAAVEADQTRALAGVTFGGSPVARGVGAWR